MDAPDQSRQPTPSDDLAALDSAPVGMPYTVLFPDADGFAYADLEYPAHLPRVGDRVEYIDEAGAVHGYIVDAVIHTYQGGMHRPRVDGRRFTPTALARMPGDVPEAPGRNGSIRAGLPQVVLARASDAPEPTSSQEDQP